MTDEIAPYFAPLEPGFSPSVVIDVGAATGHFAIPAAHAFPGSVIYAFEPDERQRILLKRNLALNRTTNVEVQPFGLWNEPTKLAFRTNGAESSFAPVSRFAGELPFPEQVAVISLDQWREQNRIEAIDLIKADAEGAEIEILEGARQTLRDFRPRLLIQAYHLRDGIRTLERCAEIVKEAGYASVEESPPGSGMLDAR